MSWSRWATIGIVGVHLFVLPMAAVVTGWVSHTVLLSKVPMLAEGLFFIPPFVAWLAFWTANYEVESVIRERSFPYRLAQGLPAHPMPPLSKYLSMQIRHNFYLLVLIGIASFVEWLGDNLQGRIAFAPQVATAIAFAAVMLLVPWMITRIWTTVPLRGPLRNRLDGIAKQYHVRFRNILIWKTHNQVTNAAILGPVRFARYFLMTDALLEQLTDQQIEAVFAHEIGHGVHRHILWYLGGMIGAMCFAGGVAGIAQACFPPALNAFSAAHLGGANAGELILTMLLIGLFLTVGFSFVSHRFEHQADWFAARHMGKVFAARPQSLPMPAVALTEAPDPSEFDASIVDVKPLPPQVVTVEEYAAGHYPHARGAGVSSVVPPKSGPNILNAPPPPPVVSPEVAGTEVFISSLDTLMEITHRSREKGGWMHPSVNHRVRLQRTLATDPAAVEEFRRRMVVTRLIIAVVIVLGIIGGLITWRLPEPAVPPGVGGQEPPAIQAPTSDDGKKA
jgi:Zn-dependent protease with chaperone function